MRPRVPKAWHSCFLDNFAVTWAAIGPFLRAPLESLKPSRKVAGPQISR